ncbi:DUF6263 family protein [Tenacibaculum sp. 190130A14a]
MKKIALLLLLTMSIVGMAQEKVLLRLNYEKGDVYETKMHMKQDLAGMMDLDIVMNMNMKINAIEGGLYNTEMKISHVTMNMTSQGNTMKYDSNDKEEDMNRFAKGAHSKMKPILTSSMEFTYDKLADVKDVKLISGTASIDSFKENSNTIVYPKEAVELGTSWKESKTTSQGVKLNYEYKVTSIDANKVVLTITGTISEIGTGDFNGKASVDRKTGNVSEMNVDMNMNVMGQKIKQNISMTTTKM